MNKISTAIISLTLVLNGCSKQLMYSYSISKYENLNDRCACTDVKSKSCETTCFELSKLYYSQAIDSFTELAKNFEATHPIIDSAYIVQDSLLESPNFNMAILKANQCISCYGRASLDEERFALYVMSYFFSKKHYIDSYNLINEFISKYPESKYIDLMQLMLILTYNNLTKYNDALTLLDTFETRPESTLSIPMLKRIREIILVCQKYRK